MPAFGTGQLGYPHDVVAEDMYKALVDFSRKNRNSGIQEVHFVVYHLDKTSCQAFEKQQSSVLSGAKTVRSKDIGDLDYDAQATSTTSSGEGIHMFGKVKVTVKGGDLLAEDAYCIVNSTDADLDLTIGAVSKVLLQRCGKELQTDLENKKSDMKRTGIVITRAPNLPSQAIMHIVINTNDMKGTVIKCLEKAELHKMTSIALPALGTGIRTMGVTDIAQGMADAVKDFSKQKPKYLNDIRLVIFQKDMIDKFNQIVEESACEIKPKHKRFGQWLGGLISKFSGSPKDEQLEGEFWQGGNQGNKNEVKFCILSLDEREINKAIKKLDSVVENEMETKTFNDYIIQQFDANQILEVTSMAKQCYVDIKIDQPRCMIKLYGIKSNFFKAYEKIHSFIRNAIQMDCMANMAQWYVIHITEIGEDLRPYHRELSLKFETAYKQNVKQMRFTLDGTDYILDFESMEEYPEDDQTNVAKVVRRNVMKGSSYDIPSNWDDMKGANLRVVDLMPSDKEYTDMEKQFLSSCGKHSYTVTKIQRVQNVTLWEQFQSKRKQLQERNARATQNERLLWHGTTAEAVDSINAHGFNRSFCGQNAVAFGRGVYFAVEASYSCHDTYSAPDSSGIKRMYYSRVLTGEYTEGKQGLRQPPNKPFGGPHCLYDSVINDETNLQMFVVFNDTQAYPEYIVCFK